MAQRGRPDPFHLGQGGVCGTGGLVAVQHAVQAVPLLLDHAHPCPQDARANFGDPVDLAGLTGLGPFIPSGDQAIAFELGQRPVHRGPLDLAEAQILQFLDQAVAIARFLGDQEQQRREQKMARRGELEPGLV